MGEVKVWGKTEPVWLADGLHIHRITFETGGVCSEHYHNYRHNLFYVLSGELLIRVWNRTFPHGWVVNEHVLRAHEAYSVPPGWTHQFEGIKSGVALEVYWHDSNGEEIDAYDIVRLTQGFMR